MFRLGKKTIPDLAEARVQITHVREYYSMRARNGDPFFDQSQVDDIAAVKSALAALDVLEAGGYDTGVDRTEKVMAEVWNASRAKAGNSIGYEIDWSSSS